MLKLLERLGRPFQKGGKLEKLYPLYEATETFLYTPASVTRGASHVRDGLDLKRMMVVVVWALTPCVLLGMYFTGHQANLAIDAGRGEPFEGWRTAVLEGLGVGFAPDSVVACLLHGALWFIPLYVITMIAGGAWEVLFATVRRHEVNEGFLVTGLLFPLTLSPTTPLWQAAIGISFGVVIGKEVFGGTGKNFLNPALTARAFLYFAYPAQLSGDRVWTAADGFSGATILGACQIGGTDAVTGGEHGVTWAQAFLGDIQGSIGETSVPACLFGAAVLILTGIGSWRIMLAMLLGALGASVFFWGVGSSTNPMFEMSPAWHLVAGGLAFGLVFMATDPVSAAMTAGGKWVYGVLIGVLTILVRVVNPAYPEGVMLAILFGNVFAPLIDHFVVKAHIKRRAARRVQG